MSEWQGCLLLAVPERSWHRSHLMLGEGSSSEWYYLVMRPPLVPLSPITSLLYFLFSSKDFSRVGYSVFFNESFLSYSREQLVHRRVFSPFLSAGDTQNLSFHLYVTCPFRVFFIFMSPLLTPEILDAKRRLFQHFKNANTHTHTLFKAWP